MILDNIGMKDVLDWTMPLLLGWIGSGARKYLKAIRTELSQAKDSVMSLTIQIAKVIERTEANQKEIQEAKLEIGAHEKRIRHVEQRVPRRGR